MSVFFWNVENFFAPGQFEAHSWSKSRFYAKCAGVAKTVLLAGDEIGAAPDLVCLAEVGDASVLKALVRTTALRKLDYRYLHFDSPDRRGIDCALLYRKESFSLVEAHPCHIFDSAGAIVRTRDILLAQFSDSQKDTFAVLVNHHPSKVGAGSEFRRGIAMRRMLFLVDSLERAGCRRVICLGDFNEEVPDDADLTMCGGFPPGTIKFQGKWEKIDCCPVLEGFRGTQRIFSPAHLTTRDAAYGGEKPLRTFSGPRYLGGLSDHYPIMLLLENIP